MHTYLQLVSTVLFVAVMIIIILLSLLQFATANIEIGDNLVNNALIHEFEHDNEVIAKLRKYYDMAKGTQINFEISRIRRRCKDYFAWYVVYIIRIYSYNFHDNKFDFYSTSKESFYEIENAVFFNGKIYLGNLDKEVSVMFV